MHNPPRGCMAERVPKPQIGEPRPPRGLLLLLFRLPISLFHAGLGWMLRRRLLLLTHTGRRTDLSRETVLEVIHHDAASDVYFVVSAWGERTDWLRNVRKTPEVSIHVGRRRAAALARPLSTEKGEAELLDYVRRHPIAARLLSRLIGYRVTGTEEEYREIARRVVVVALHPAESGEAGRGDSRPHGPPAGVK